MHELAELLLKLALNQTHNVDRLVAPPVSEYCNANIWLVPDPEFGVTESAVTPAVAVMIEVGSLTLALTDPPPVTLA